MDDNIEWHQHGPQEMEFSKASVQMGDTLLFGRKTYEMMRAFWPTPMAVNTMPEIAAGMNESEKWVASRTLTAPGWENAKVIQEDVVTFLQKAKQDHSSDITLLGSGTILELLSNHHLIDEYQFLIDPIIVQNGVPILSKIQKNINLKLVHQETFDSGGLLCYYHLK